MITASWNSSSGWSAPHLQPYEPLSLAPTASVFHYGTSCFEGLKAYRGVDGRLRLFRPTLNCARMVRSAARVALPGFDPAQLQRLIEQLVAREAPRWLPQEHGEGLMYLRPTLIGTGTAIGVQKPTEALLYIVAMMMPSMNPPGGLSTAGPQSLPPTSSAAVVTREKQEEEQHQNDKTEKLGLHLLASQPHLIRSWPGGFGHSKVGANYGPTLASQAEARARGFDQVLWLFGPEGQITEAGATNFFVVWRRQGDGRRELVTAPIGGDGDGRGGEGNGAGLILDGVTRASVLETVRRGWASTSTPTSNPDLRTTVAEIEVVERNFTMADLLIASREGRLEEAFVTGTAYFVAPVQRIELRGETVRLPLSKVPSQEGRGSSSEVRGCPIAMAAKRFLSGVMYGRVSHEWGVVVEEN